MADLARTCWFSDFLYWNAVNVTRTGCGETKLCLDEPVGCDPAVAGSSCLFAAIVGAPAEAPNGKSLTITLSGETTGYIAIGLTANSSVGATAVFVCGQRNGTFLFSTTQNNNSTLTNGDTPVEDIVGQVDGSVIQCEFTVPNATATGSSHVTTFVVELGTGTINGTTLGPFSVKKTVGPLDVTNLANEVAQTTATPTLNVTTMPMNVTTMPMNVTTMPMNVTTMPMNVTTMPMNVTTMPMNVTTMPMNATTSQNSATQPTSSAVAFLSSGEGENCSKVCGCFSLVHYIVQYLDLNIL
ncbi:putative ferric-chelate reductase 1 [Merluccius polli]|uniref:Ferric-chelate reductase 1 n=1 Tax=Merluccius polli TaxID=89951 RepID=A0AA47P357_MERPO|nr:putative ferric-chelate reductase 1 [Merluccius polli]